MNCLRSALWRRVKVTAIIEGGTANSEKKLRKRNQIQHRLQKLHTNWSGEISAVFGSATSVNEYTKRRIVGLPDTPRCSSRPAYTFHIWTARPFWGDKAQAGLKTARSKLRPLKRICGHKHKHSSTIGIPREAELAVSAPLIHCQDVGIRRTGEHQLSHLEVLGGSDPSAFSWAEEPLTAFDPLRFHCVVVFLCRSTSWFSRAKWLARREEPFASERGSLFRGFQDNNCRKSSTTSQAHHMVRRRIASQEVYSIARSV